MSGVDSPANNQGKAKKFSNSNFRVAQGDGMVGMHESWVGSDFRVKRCHKVREKGNVSSVRRSDDGFRKVGSESGCANGGVGLRSTFYSNKGHTVGQQNKHHCNKKKADSWMRKLPISLFKAKKSKIWNRSSILKRRKE